jgi:hypothetical protein
MRMSRGERGGGSLGGLTGGPHPGVVAAAHNRPCARRAGDAGESAGPLGELGQGGKLGRVRRLGRGAGELGRASAGQQGGEGSRAPAGPQCRAGPREGGGLGWAKGGGARLGGPQEEKGERKGLGVSIFPFLLYFLT